MKRNVFQEKRKTLPASQLIISLLVAIIIIIIIISLFLTQLQLQQNELKLNTQNAQLKAGKKI